MKTFNIRYRNVEKLKDFLDAHALHNQERLLVQVFTSLASSSHILTLAEALKTFLPSAVIMGCSTDGEIIDGNILTNNTVIMITLFEKTDLKMLFVSHNDDAKKQGKLIAKTLLTKDTKALILLATFDSFNAQTLLETIYHDKRRNKELVISGALAADAGKFKNSFVFDGEQIVKNGIIALALSGSSLRASNHFLHDWEPISRKFRVNDVRNNRAYKLDDKVAKDVYSQYLGLESSAQLSYYALQFPFVASRGGHYISKFAISNDEDGSLTFTSNIKEGEILQIAFANIDKIAQSSEKLFEEVVKNPNESIFIYASSARRRFLEHFAHQEIESLSNITTMGGFFGFSEFFANTSECRLLSQSLTMLSLSESDEVKVLSFKEGKKTVQNDLDYKTVKVLSNIAKVSSSELEAYNKELERRVSKGVRENRKKDSIMIHNSKLAQLGEMMGLIAHQWRQPLSAISATASGMQIKFELDSWSPAYVESSLNHIEEYVLHLSDTINDFTDFFKPTKRKESVTSREMIKKALFIMSPLLMKENVEVLKKYASKNSIDTYPNEVVQVLLNLIKNSVNALLKNAVKNPEIYITEYRADEKNVIEISDNAGGINVQVIDKIFEPYFSTKNAEDSMGLGLYMARFIIEDSCGGTITVENAREGAKFTITL